MKKYSLILTVCILLLSLHSKAQITQKNYKKDSVKLSQILDSIDFYIYTDPAKAYDITTNTFNNFKETSFIKGKIELLQRISFINCYYKFDPYSSTKALNEIRLLSDSINYKRGLPLYELYLGLTYYIQDDLDKASALYKSSITHSKEINDSALIAEATAGLADILMQNNKLDSAKHQIFKALNITKKLKSYRTSMLLYDDLANIYKMENMPDSALLCFQKTEEAAQLCNNPLGKLVSKLNIHYLQYLSDPSIDFIAELRNCHQKILEMGFIRVYISIGKEFANLLYKKKDYKNAFNLYSEMNHLSDSLKVTEQMRKAVKVEADYILTKKELENHKLQHKTEVQYLKLKSRKIIILFIGCILVISIILLYNIFRKYKTIQEHVKTIKVKSQKIQIQQRILLEKEKEVIENKLKSQERELSGKMMKIYHHNQLLSKITVDLKEIIDIQNSKGNNKKTVSKKVQALINQLNLSPNNDMWKEFEKSFTETNPGFLERLSKKHPDLTPNELRLCIFLVLNLRTKEISVITQQSIKSINVARTRLRKKLELDNSKINLSVFLKTI